MDITNAAIINKRMKHGTVLIQMERPDWVRLESDTQSRWMPDPGIVPEGITVCCGVCGEPMECTRNLEGPTSYVAAMAKSKRKHDSFFCPHQDAQWHNQATALRSEADKTPSGILHSLYMHEAAQIVESRKCTVNLFSRGV